MPLPISEDLLKDMAVMVVNYTKICRHLGLNDEQMRSVNAGDWIINAFNRYAKDFLSEKTAAIANSEKGNKEVAMPEIPGDA